MFWQSPERFAGPSRRQATRQNSFYFRRNRLSDVTYASYKVLLFENKDFVHPDSPQWNTVGATPQVAVVDGSARSVRMSDVIADTDMTSIMPGSQHADGLAFPSGSWSPGETIMAGRQMYGAPQGFQWTYGQPAYFWATRNGIRGRDFLQ